MIKFVGFVRGGYGLQALTEDGRVWNWLPVDLIWKNDHGEEFDPYAQLS